MKNFHRLAIGVNTGPLLAKIARNPGWWHEDTYLRTFPQGPFGETDSIILRVPPRPVPKTEEEKAEYLRTDPACRCHVRFEDLLQSPAAVVRALNAHFGLPLVENWEASLDALRIRRGNREKWRSLPPSLLANVESLVASELRGYGYALSGGEASLPTRPVIRDLSVRNGPWPET